MIKINGIKVFKKCTICKRHLPYSCFGHNRSRTDGYECFCRECNVIRARQWREKNRQRMNEIVYASTTRHRDRANARALSHYYYPEAQKCIIKGCEELGERHHNNYKNPKDIIWLCKRHHNLLYHNHRCIVEPFVL